MGQLFRVLTGLVGIISSLVRLFESWKMRKEARTVVVAEIKEKEAEVTRVSSEVVADRSPESGAAERLRNGQF